MSQARRVFEALMRGNGYTDDDLVFIERKGYAKSSTQTRWRFFLLGWEMAFSVRGQA